MKYKKKLLAKPVWLDIVQNSYLEHEVQFAYCYICLLHDIVVVFKSRMYGFFILNFIIYCRTGAEISTNNIENQVRNSCKLSFD